MAEVLRHNVELAATLRHSPFRNRLKAALANVEDQIAATSACSCHRSDATSSERDPGRYMEQRGACFRQMGHVLPDFTR